MNCQWCGVERDAPAAGPHQCDADRVRRRALQDAAAEAVGDCVCEPCSNIRRRIEGAQWGSWEQAYGFDRIRPA